MTFRLPYVTPAKRQFQQQSAPDQLHTDINFYPNPIPFKQTEWPSVKPVKISAPDVTHTDINLYPNPIPFNNSILLGISVSSRPTASDATDPSEIWLFAVTPQTPFVNVDWSKPLNIPGAPFPYYPNIAIKTVVASPFIPVDMSSSRVSVTTSSPTQPYNVNLYTVVAQPAPFIPVQWGPAFVASVTPNPVAPYYNINLFGETLVPFNVPFDVVKTPNFVQQAGLYNLNLYGQTVIIGAPFAQLDWPKPSLPQIATPQFAPTNINLFTNPIPFGPYDYPRIVPNRYLPFDTNGFPNLVLPNSSTPFVSYDWSKPLAVKASIDPLYPNIVVLQPVLPPFSQLDWSKAYTISPKASNQNDLPNLLLIQPSIPGRPLGINGWFDWSYVKGPVIIVPDQNNLPNIVLFNTTPVPPTPDVVVGGAWRWLDGYNDLIEPRKNIAGDVKKAAAVLSQMGGHARAAALTAKQRTNIATTAANTRWGKR